MEFEQSTYVNLLTGNPYSLYEKEHADFPDWLNANIVVTHDASPKLFLACALAEYLQTMPQVTLLNPPLERHSHRDAGYSVLDNRSPFPTYSWDSTSFVPADFIVTCHRANGTAVHKDAIFGNEYRSTQTIDTKTLDSKYLLMELLGILCINCVLSCANDYNRCCSPDPALYNVTPAEAEMRLVLEGIFDTSKTYIFDNGVPKTFSYRLDLPSNEHPVWWFNAAKIYLDNK